MICVQLFFFFPNFLLMEESGQERQELKVGRETESKGCIYLPHTWGLPLLQGSSREEPCQAFAIRSWPWSAKSRAKSCGFQPARRRPLCWERRRLVTCVGPGSASLTESPSEYEHRGRVHEQGPSCSPLRRVAPGPAQQTVFLTRVL